MFSAWLAGNPVPGGTFQPQTSYVTGTCPFSVAIGDLNGDGKPDLAVIDANPPNLSNSISVLLGNGDGTFQSKTTYATGLDPVSVAIGDLNRDGKLDLAVTNEHAGTVSILLGNGDGTFQAQTTYATQGAAPFSVAICGSEQGR
jgi:FG-GAP-like repeat